MSEPIVRREALRRLFGMSAALAAPLAVLGCEKKETLSCTDTAGLTAEEIAVRTNTKYVDVSMFPDKKCDGCTHYVAGAANACGSCKVVKGPIHPSGYCTLFAAKA